MIRTAGLGRDFGAHTAVRSLDLEVARGELFGFLGPNGAGKTTTIRMLCALLAPTRGRVVIAGHDLASNPQPVRELLGFVPDTPPLYEYLTGIEYVGFVASLYGTPPDRRDERAAYYLDAFDLSDRADELCRGYSHGMRKKLHLAAILCTGPELLVLDEPTSGLDPESARRLKDVLLEARDAGTTIFMSTHVLDVAEELCDRIGVLSRGELRAVGTMAELRAGREERSLEDVFLELVQTGGDAER